MAKRSFPTPHDLLIKKVQRKTHVNLQKEMLITSIRMEEMQKQLEVIIDPVLFKKKRKDFEEEIEVMRIRLKRKTKEFVGGLAKEVSKDSEELVVAALKSKNIPIPKELD